MSLNEVRRHHQSSVRSNEDADSGEVAVTSPGQDTSGPESAAATLDAPRGGAASSRKRARAASSDGTAAPDGVTLPVLVAREQQPRQRRVAAVARPRPPHDRLVLRARERDVREPQVLAALLVDVLRRVALPLRALEPDVDRPPPGRVVERHRLLVLGAGDGSQRSG